MLSRTYLDGVEMIQGMIKPRWVPEIIDVLSKKESSYAKLLESIPYISGTELQRKLTLLQEKGLVHKTQLGSQSVYCLSQFGQDILHILYHFIDIHARYHTT